MSLCLPPYAAERNFFDDGWSVCLFYFLTCLCYIPDFSGFIVERFSTTNWKWEKMTLEHGKNWVLLRIILILLMIFRLLFRRRENFIWFIVAIATIWCHCQRLLVFCEYLLIFHFFLEFCNSYFSFDIVFGWFILPVTCIRFLSMTFFQLEFAKEYLSELRNNQEIILPLVF